MEPLTIALIVLVAAGVWAIVELALTVRKARATVDEVARSAKDTLDQVQPIISKVDGIVDEMQPTMKRVDPLVEQAQVSVGLLNESLAKVDDILGDVSDVSASASNISAAASNVVSSAANAATGVASRITGKKFSRQENLEAGDAPVALGEGSDDVAPEVAVEKPAPKHAAGVSSESAPAPKQSGYVTYAAVAADDDE